MAPRRISKTQKKVMAAQSVNQILRKIIPTGTGYEEVSSRMNKRASDGDDTAARDGTGRDGAVPPLVATSFASVKGGTARDGVVLSLVATSAPSVKGGTARDTAVPSLVATSDPSVKGATGIEEKGPTSPAKGGSLRATWLVLTVVVAVVVSILLLVRFHGRPMSQVWVLSVSICLYVFLLLRIFPRRWFYTDFLRLSYGPLLAFFSASRIGSATTTFVLLFSMVYAAGNMGYSLAVHHLPKGAELAIHEVTSNSCHSKDVEELNLTLHTGAPFAVLLWTLVMALFLSLGKMTDELDILMFLCYFGWIHVGVWLVILSEVPMNGFPFEELIEWLMVTLFPWMILSPGISLISQILAVGCHLLLMLALTAFLWYNLAIYMHFLATTAQSKKIQVEKDILHNITPFGKKKGPRPGETASEAAATPGEAAATLGDEHTLHSKILEGKKDGPRPGETASEAAATLGDEYTLYSKSLDNRTEAMKYAVARIPGDAEATSSDAAATLGDENPHHIENLKGKLVEGKTGLVESVSMASIY